MKGAIKLIDAAGNGKLSEKHNTVPVNRATAQIARVKVDNLDGDLKNLFSAWKMFALGVRRPEFSAAQTHGFRHRMADQGRGMGEGQS